MVQAGEPLRAFGDSFELVGSDGQQNQPLADSLRNAGLGAKGPVALAFDTQSGMRQAPEPLAAPASAPAFRPQNPSGALNMG
jgi:hypothetical protein